MLVLMELLACVGELSPIDTDNDGYNIAPGDCLEGDGSVFPGAVEVWYDGIDQDCDGNDADQDGDGFFPDAYDRISTSLAAFPDGGSLDDLEDAGVGWLVVDRRSVSDADLDRVEADPDWAIAFEGEDHTVLQRVTDAP